MEIDLTNTELFDDFSSFEKNGVHVDLHNAFNCKSVKYSNRKRELVLYFVSNSYNNVLVKGVSVVFSDCLIDNYAAVYEDGDSDFDTIDVMYRERFETNSGDLSEVSEDGQHYYCINFLPEVNFEVFAKKVTAILSFDVNQN